MKVLMLTWEYPPHIVGGLGSHVAELVPALMRAGVEVTVVTPGLRPAAKEEALGRGVVRRVGSQDEQSTGNFLVDVQTANLLLQRAGEELSTLRGPYDVVHVHDWMVGSAGIALKHALRIPLVATIHATERGRTGGGLHNSLNVAINSNEWWLCYEAWRVVTTTRYMANEVMEYFHVPVDKLDVIPNGVDRSRFDELPERGSEAMQLFRRAYVADEERLVYHVGRLVGEKGVHLLVDAAPAVLAAVPAAKFVVAGKGPLLLDMRRRVVERGLDAKFFFTGFVSDADRDRLFRVADVAVFPSLYEPFGIVALEAMAARAPLVVSRAGGLAEIVEHGVTGVHVYPDNPDSLAWGIVHTLQNPEWAVARVSAAYEQVRSEYDWDGIADQTLSVFRRVARERQSVDW
jgi:glycogen synthase